jgi:short-subunit dehydrogenase
MLQPKSILITGGSSGIGAALAEHYAASGVTIFISGRDKDRLEAVAQKCRAKGAVVHPSPVDVNDKVTMSSGIGWADTTQPLELVIANAGISAGTEGGGESEAQTRQIFMTNVEGVVNTIYPALDAMQKRPLPANNVLRGQIAIMSSLAAFRGFPGAPAYCASKAAVKTIGESWRGMLLAQKIGVTVICPGYVDTPMTKQNKFIMPLLMNAPRAANIIAEGLARNRPRIAFPFFTYMMVWFLMVLPPRLFDRLLSGLPQKGSLPPNSNT